MRSQAIRRSVKPGSSITCYNTGERRCAGIQSENMKTLFEGRNQSALLKRMALGQSMKNRLKDDNA